MQQIKVYELYNVWYTPWWQTGYAKAAVICMCLLIVFMISWFLLKWLRARKTVPYWQQALARCAQLRNASNSLELPLVYVHLTSLLKKYLETRYKEPFTNLTDLELNNALEKLPLTQEQKKNIQELLTYAVPAKFNSHQSELFDPIIHISHLEQLIKDTYLEAKPVESY